MSESRLQPDSPHLLSVPCPEGGMEWGCGGRASGMRFGDHQAFPRLGPKTHRPQQPAPTESDPWLFPTPPELPSSQGPRQLLLVTRLSALPLPRRLFLLPISQLPLLPFIFRSHVALHLSSLTRLPPLRLPPSLPQDQFLQAAALVTPSSYLMTPGPRPDTDSICRW